MKLTPQDIYNFYFLEYMNSNNQIIDKSGLVAYLNQLKNKYLKLLKPIIVNQIQKYINRGRVDDDLTKVDDGETLQSLLNKMKKTYRSDMSRRNNNWENILTQLLQLQKSSDVKQIIHGLDRVNNAIHNTGQTVLTKLSDGYTLMNALEKAHNIKDIQQLQRLTDTKVTDELTAPLDKKDLYLKRKFGNYTFESKFNTLFNKIITEQLQNIENKLKEIANKMFKDKREWRDNQSFSKYINQYDLQPSLCATKYVANHKLLKNYQIKCCKGMYKGYQYFFPLIETDDQKFVIDFGDNLDGAIVAKVVPLASSDYKIKKVMDTVKFNNQYDKFIKEYNK